MVRRGVMVRFRVDEDLIREADPAGLKVVYGLGFERNFALTKNFTYVGIP